MKKANVVIEETAVALKMSQEALLVRIHLKAEGIYIAFGGQQVLRGANLDLAGGQIALLRGPNGCGKTTLLNILSGFLKPDIGKANFECNGILINILNKTPDQLARLGLARLWQDIRLFPTMTVLENVLAASPHAIGINPARALFALSKVKQQEREFREQALAWLEMLGIADRADSSGDKLSVGQSKRVAIARLLQTGAKILLLDEPLAGLDCDAATKLVEDLNRLADATHRAMLVVEHNQDAITPVCDLRYTLNNGVLMREELEGRQWVC
ncbi:MAG: ATP-binding cassette domain-containing protein [Cyclobacteriaceae bacterium]|nr:ATP-binding cassette domain-containing protein [Cyclobacteriaceae bacterium]